VELSRSLICTFLTDSACKDSRENIKLDLPRLISFDDWLSKTQRPGERASEDKSLSDEEVSDESAI